MPLSKDVLGQDLYNVQSAFNNMSIAEIIMMYNDLESARLAFKKKEAEAIINHIKNNMVLTIPATGYVAPNGGGSVTGTSVTGTAT